MLESARGDDATLLHLIVLMLGIICAAFCATCAGGLFALKLKDKLHLVLGFSAGAVVAVSLFDLLPEAMEIGSPHKPAELLSWLLLSFMAYLVLDRVKLLHRETPDDPHGPGHHRAMLGGSTFSAHSFLDGLAIGVAFQASVTVGAIVTIAVLTHDFSDGINTVNVVLKNGGSRALARRWLLMDAVAPGLGILCTLFLQVPQGLLGITLAIFSGFFLYIGASDLIPESHHAHPKFFTTAMTLLGALVIYGSVQLAGG